VRRSILRAVVVVLSLDCALLARSVWAQTPASGPLPPGPTPVAMPPGDLNLDLGATNAVTTTNKTVVPPPSAPTPLPPARAPLVPTPAHNAVPMRTPPPLASTSLSARMPAPLGPETPVGPQTPALSIEKIGPATLTVGKRLSYEIVVRNTSRVPVFNVRIEEPLPAGTQFLDATPPPDDKGKTLVWDLAGLEPGAERRFHVQVQPGGEGEVTSNTRATFSVSAGLRTRITQPRLTVSEIGPDQTVVGNTVVFQIHITNTGTGPALNVAVRDRLPVGLKHPQGQDIEADLGTIQPGQSKDLALQTIASKGGPVINEVVATADGGVMTRAQAHVLILEPELTLHKTGPLRRYLNREAEFDLEVSNPGTAPARNVHIMDILPAGLEFVAASDDGRYDEATRTVNWSIPALSPAEHRHVKVRATARGIGDLINRAAATADGSLSAKSENAVHVEGMAALELEVVDLDDPVEVGAETSYEIRVRNQGTAPSTGLQIMATAPPGMAIRGAEGPTRNRIQGQQVVFEALQRLAPRADVRFRVRVVGLKAGDMRFKVQMNADHLKQPVYEEESTQVYDDAK